MKRLFSFSWTGIHPEGYLLPVYFLILVWLLYEIYIRKRGVVYKRIFAIFCALFLAALVENFYEFRNFPVLFFKLILLTFPFAALLFLKRGRTAGGGRDFKKMCLWIWSGAVLLEAGRACWPHHSILWIWLYAFFPVLSGICHTFLVYFRVRPSAAAEGSPSGPGLPDHGIYTACRSMLTIQLINLLLFSVILYSVLCATAGKGGYGMLPAWGILAAIQLLFFPGMRKTAGSVLCRYIPGLCGGGKDFTAVNEEDGNMGGKSSDRYGFLERITVGSHIRQGRYRTGISPAEASAAGKPGAGQAGSRGNDRSGPAGGETYSGRYPDKDTSDEDRLTDLLEDGATEDAVIIRRLVHYFEKDKPFLHPDLKIGEVALQIYTNKTYLSRALNRKTAKNFNQFVNYFRIKEACRMFLEQPHLRAQELCDKCGFNSISSFSTAFRINTGYSPAEWCKEVKCKLNNDEPVSLEEYFI